VIIASSRSIYGEGRYFAPDLDTYVYPKHRLQADLDRGDFEVKHPGCNKPLKLVPTDEESKIHPSSVYGITKHAQEQLVMTVCPTIGISPVALRYQNVYGPGQSLSNPYTGILSIFSTLIRTGKPINIFEDGKESRDFVFIDDVVSATFASVVNQRADGHVFNVGTGEPVDVSIVAATLIKAYGKEVPVVVSGNYRLGDIRHNFADTTKITSLLGWKAEVPFTEGIRKFANWVTTQQVVESRYDNSIKEMKDRGLLK
jgi:dTDP-L-rhamnose 4-epimerase